MKRRTFLKNSTLALGGLGLCCSRKSVLPKFELKTLTLGPKHHFFGYYGICPWNDSQKYLVCLKSDFQDHLPSPDEPGAIGLVDAKTGRFEKVTETNAWNLQQGAMLHWNPQNPEYEIIHNDRQEGEIVSVVFNTQTGQKRVLPRPVSALSRNGKFALSLTYGRMGRLRKVVGYEGAIDPNPTVAHPDNDGIFLLDMKTGETKLVVSIKQVYDKIAARHPELKERHIWFNHTVINRTDTRFFFLARTNEPGVGLQTGMFTAHIDGSDLREVIPYGKRVSHFDWRNDREIIATFQIKDSDSARPHVLFTDGEYDYKTVGTEIFAGDGHCSFSPNEKWIVTDQKFKKSLEQALFVYDVENKKGAELVRLNMMENRYISGNTRCDFHPRWDRTGDAICFDALDQNNGTRQLHIVDLNFG